MADGPLSGVRIIEFTWIGVGPYCTFLCSLMGAECIRIETGTRPIYYRGPASQMERDPVTGRILTTPLNQFNVNKLSACIDLKEKHGLELVKELVAISDVVAENFQPGVMDRLGLGYSEVKKVNPAAVMVSMSSHGATGPERDGKGLAAVFGALGGASHITGFEDGPPVELRLSTDLVSGTMSCFALLGALHRARKTGEGAWLDCSSREVVSSFIGEALLDAIVNKRDQPRQGNRDTIMAPHDVFPCDEADSWISIAVSTQEEWEGLCRVLGADDWLKDPRYGDGFLRWKNQDSMNGRIREWTSRQHSHDAMAMLQAAGVPATVSYNAQEILTDLHLHDRDSFLPAADEDGEPYVMMGLPWKLSKAVAQAPTRPPTIGEHNQYVFEKILGMGGDDVRELVRKGVIA